MEVQRCSSLNHQPSFQMRYKSPGKWDTNILKSLRESKLAKEIDARFPYASSTYTNDPYIIIKFNLAKKIKHVICGASDESVINEIKTTKLDNILKEIAEKTAQKVAERQKHMTLVEIVKEENRKILINRIKSFFGFGKTNY